MTCSSPHHARSGGSVDTAHKPIYLHRCSSSQEKSHSRAFYGNSYYLVSGASLDCSPGPPIEIMEFSYKCIKCFRKTCYKLHGTWANPDFYPKEYRMCFNLKKKPQLGFSLCHLTWGQPYVSLGTVAPRCPLAIGCPCFVDVQPFKVHGHEQR